ARLVDRDAPQPAGEGIEAPLRARGLHDADERFLRHVLGGGGVTDDRVREPEDGSPVPLDERAEGALVVAVAIRLEEGLVAGGHPAVASREINAVGGRSSSR